MDSTPASLLERVRQPSDVSAWQRFVELYTPLLYTWARRLGLQDADAADFVQDLFAHLVVKLPDFAYDRTRSFRAWLRTVALNHYRNRLNKHPLPTAGGDQLSAVAAPPDEAFWEAEYRRTLIDHALTIMQAEFQPTTWKACWESVVKGRSTDEVAAELGLSSGAVRVARFRVLTRLRNELRGLLD